MAAKAAKAKAAEQRAQTKAEIVLGHVQDLMRSVEEDHGRVLGAFRRRVGTTGDSAAESEREGEDRDSARLSE